MMGGRVKIIRESMNFAKNKLKELVTPDLFIPELQRKREELCKLLELKRRALKNLPAGRLRIAVNRGKPQWFHVNGEKSPKGTLMPNCEIQTSNCTKQTCSSQVRAVQKRTSQNSAAPSRDSLRGTYIPQSNERLARCLAQKSYDERVCDAAEKSLAAIDEFLDAYERANVCDVFQKMHSARQALSCPVFFSDKEFARMWLAIPYEGKGFSNEDALLITARGERVRSKSEMTIANTLARLGVPYRYEFPCRLVIAKDNKNHTAVFYPDFTCLNLRTRQEFIWEHFGLVDDADYAQNMNSKIRAYATNGYFAGVNLIMTSESMVDPLSSDLVQLFAEKYLL